MRCIFKHIGKIISDHSDERNSEPERTPVHQAECCFANPIHFRADSALQL